MLASPTFPKETRWFTLSSQELGLPVEEPAGTVVTVAFVAGDAVFSAAAAAEAHATLTLTLAGASISIAGSSGAPIALEGGEVLHVGARRRVLEIEPRHRVVFVVAKARTLTVESDS